MFISHTLLSSTFLSSTLLSSTFLSPTPVLPIPSPYSAFMGIDIAKHTFVAISSHDNAVRTFSNSPKGFEAFRKTYKNTLNDTWITLEITGRYEMTLIRYLLEHSYSVHRARPIQVKNFIRSLGLRGKTDPLDAKALMMYGQERHTRLPLFKALSKELEDLDRLMRRRDDLLGMQTKEKNRLQAPDNDLTKSSIEDMLTVLHKAIETIDIQIDAIFDANEILKKKTTIARTIPGIGTIIAKNLIASIPELGTVDRKHIASLIGLAPHPKDSGEKSAYRRTSKGRQHVKSTLFIAAMSASRSHSTLGDHYKKLIGNGKKPMVALTALMRKILVILNAKIGSMDKVTEPVDASTPI